MRLIDFLRANFTDDVADWCLERHNLDQDLKTGDDLVFDVTNMDREGLSGSAKDHVEPVERFYYWLDSDEDSNSYIDELFKIDRVVVISSITVGPYSDDESDAYGTIRLILCPDEQTCDETLSNLCEIARHSAIRVLSGPLVCHRRMLGNPCETAQALTDIILEVMDKDHLKDQLLFLNELVEGLIKTRLQTALRCFGTVLQEQALEYRAQEGRRELSCADGTVHDLEEIITSVDRYLALSQTLGAPATAVDSSTLRVAAQVLAATAHTP